jgi:hypothetical protein
MSCTSSRTFIYFQVPTFISPLIHHLFVYMFPTTEPSQHPGVVKVAVSLLEPLLDGHSDSKLFPKKAILHWAKQMKSNPVGLDYTV